MVAHVLERCLEGYRSSFFIESKWSFSKSWGETSSKWMTRIVALKPVTAGDVGIFQYALHLLGPRCLAIRLGLLATLSGGGTGGQGSGVMASFFHGVLGYWRYCARLPGIFKKPLKQWGDSQKSRVRQQTNCGEIPATGQKMRICR